MDLYVELLASTIRMSVPLILACLRAVVGTLRHRRHRPRGPDARCRLHRGLGLRRLRLGLDRPLPCDPHLVGFALVHGYASINQRGNQVVSGVAINMLAAGLAVVLGNEWFQGRRPHAGSSARGPLPAQSRFRACVAA